MTLGSLRAAFWRARDELKPLPVLEHGFTHFHLSIVLQRLRVTALTPAWWRSPAISGHRSRKPRAAAASDAG